MAAAADGAPGRDGSAGATNIERFLDAVTPSPASSRLGDVWAFYDLAFGLEVALQFDGEETVRALSMALEARRAAETLCVRGQPVHMYFVPYLSGIRLLEPAVGDDPARVAFQYSEHERLQDRLPFAMKMAELEAQVFGALSSSRAEDYDRKASWYCVSWQPIYAVPSLPRQQQLAKGAFLTFHTLQAAVERAPTRPSWELPPPKGDGGRRKDALELEVTGPEEPMVRGRTRSRSCSPNQLPSPVPRLTIEPRDDADDDRSPVSSPAGSVSIPHLLFSAAAAASLEPWADACGGGCCAGPRDGVAPGA